MSILCTLSLDCWLDTQPQSGEIPSIWWCNPNCSWWNSILLLVQSQIWDRMPCWKSFKWVDQTEKTNTYYFLNAFICLKKPKSHCFEPRFPFDIAIRHCQTMKATWGIPPFSCTSNYHIVGWSYPITSQVYINMFYPQIMVGFLKKVW